MLARSRASLDVRLRDSWKRRYFSPATMGLYASLIPTLEHHVSGRVLDVGCGTAPFRRHVERHGVVYHSSDRELRAARVTYLADARYLSVRSASYDTILCSEVLEHLSEPEKALGEFHRALRPGGRLVLTVPFLSRLHEQPHDYFRYTEYGLRELLSRRGFATVAVEPTGAVFSFLGHQLSTVLLSSTNGVPILQELAFWVNLVICVLPCYYLDRITRLGRLMPSGYLAVAVRGDAE